MNCHLRAWSVVHRASFPGPPNTEGRAGVVVAVGIAGAYRYVPELKIQGLNLQNGVAALSKSCTIVLAQEFELAWEKAYFAY